jgi:hypothetical protein
VKTWLNSGGHLLCVGLTEAEANSFLPAPVVMRSAEHINAYFAPFPAGSHLAGVSPADVHNRDPRTLPLVTGGGEVYGDGVLAETGNVLFCQLVPWHFKTAPEQFNQRRTFGRASFAMSRLLGNLGVASSTPLLERFAEPVSPKQEGAGSKAAPAASGRCIEGLYLTTPTEWDDPYRFFRW